MEKMIRAVFYIRVSKDEQALHGFSLPAQKMKLYEYAEKMGYKVVFIYADEGISGRKMIKNRPALQQMLHDAQEDKFDIILFIKLDRYFRSVAEYHECQKILNAHDVLWDATEEKYDITTANGRAFVNMKLTIAELEADQTGERICITNDYKVKNKQAISGSVPFGYMLEKRDGASYVVKKPDEAPIVEDAYQHFMTHQSVRKTLEYINDKYDIQIRMRQFRRIFERSFYYGEYRGIQDYCPAYCTKDQFDRMAEIRANNVKVRKNKNSYLFSGLVRCDVCGRKLVGITNRNKRVNSTGTHVYVIRGYRCNDAYLDTLCTNRTYFSEGKLERYLLANLESEISKYIAKVEISEKDIKPINKSKIANIKKEMDNLNLMFRKSRISEDEYDREYLELDNQLKEATKTPEQKKRDVSHLKKILNSDFRSMYNLLTRENKRSFWRSIIKEVRKNGDSYDIIFLD